MRAALGATALAVAALVVGACAARTAGQAASGDPGAPMEITWLERIVRLDPAGEGRTIGMTSSNRVGRPCYHRAWGIVCQAYGVPR